MSPLKRQWRRFLAIGISGFFIALTGTVILLPNGVLSQSARPITGWLWTDTTGWIALDCATGGPNGSNVCGSIPQLRVAVDATTGDVTGWGWSDNVGWIKFGGLSTFPNISGSGATPLNAKLQNNVMTGWARACAGTAAGDCSSMSSRTDGWDGWISLNGSLYQVRHSSTGNTFDNCLTGGSCAWGSDVNGWVDFSYAQYQCTAQPSYCQNANILCTFDTASCGYSCTACSWQCGAGACLSPVPICDISASPEIVNGGATSTISWSSTNTGVRGCSVTGNGNSWSGTSGSQNSNPINGQTTYTEQCWGPDNTSTCTKTITINPSPNFKEI